MTGIFNTENLKPELTGTKLESKFINTEPN